MSTPIRRTVRPVLGLPVLLFALFALYACAAERPLRGGDAAVVETVPEVAAVEGCGGYHNPCPVESLLVEA